MNKQKCLNCGNDITSKLYCDTCGQKNDPKILSAKHILKEYLSELFSFESKGFRTLKYLFVPAKLTQEYVAGKRSSYLNPARLFIFTGILFFAVLSYIGNLNNKTLRGLTGLNNLESSLLYEKFDTLICKYEAEDKNHLLDSIKLGLFENITAASLDTFPKESLGIDLRKYGILYKDVYDKPIDTLLLSHGVTNWMDKMAIRQLVKFELNPAGSIKFLISNILWSLIPLLLLTAGLLMLLYYRHKPLYIECLALLSHWHSFFFIYLVIIILLNNFGLNLLDIDYIGVVVIILPLLYSYFVLSKYFNQGFFKTLFKMIILASAYVTLLILSMIFIGFLSFVLL